MSILSLMTALQSHPELCSVFDLNAFQTYIELVNILRPEIESILPSYQIGPPPTLTVRLHEFLKACFSMSDVMGKLAWEKFAKIAWSIPFVESSELEAAARKHLKLFMDHGLSRKLGELNSKRQFSLSETLLPSRCL